LSYSQYGTSEWEGVLEVRTWTYYSTEANTQNKHFETQSFGARLGPLQTHILDHTGPVRDLDNFIFMFSLSPGATSLQDVGDIYAFTDNNK